MTKEQLANKLDGNEYGDEISQDLEKQAKEDGLVVVFGSSDDLMEFCGAINEEASAYDSGTVYLTEKTLLGEHDEPCSCQFCGYASEQKICKTIGYKFGYSGWEYTTEIPCARFNIKEDGQQYGQGLVFSIDSLKQTRK